MTKLNKIFFGIIFLSLALVFISCSEDDGSNPTTSTQDNYSGLNSMNKEVLLAIVDNKVTGYSIEWEITNSNGTFSGKRAQTDSDGFADVVSNSFTITLETNEVITGTISGDSITGTFIFLTGRTVDNKPETVNGSFTVYKL